MLKCWNLKIYLYNGCYNLTFIVVIIFCKGEVRRGQLPKRICSLPSLRSSGVLAGPQLPRTWNLVAHEAFREMLKVRGFVGFGAIRAKENLCLVDSFLESSTLSDKSTTTQH